MGKIVVRAQQQNVYNMGGTGQVSQAYVLRPVRYTTMSGEDIVNYCAANSIVPKSYLSASMVAISQCIENFLMNGHSVSFPDLGIFSLSSNGISEADAAKAGVEQLNKLKLRFLPCTKLKEEIDNVSLECEGVFDIAGETILANGKREKYYKKVHGGDIAASPTGGGTETNESENSGNGNENSGTDNGGNGGSTTPPAVDGEEGL